MNATGSTAAVTTIAEAGRYLSELTATVGFEEGVRRLRSKADSAVARELDALERYVSGREADKPAAALALYGDYLKPLSGRSGAATGAATINLALRDARALADGVRVSGLLSIIEAIASQNASGKSGLKCNGLRGVSSRWRRILSAVLPPGKGTLPVTA